MKRKLKKWASSLKTKIYALNIASKDPRVPWFAKAIIVVAVAYALSPIDLIPDFIPIIGLLDDLLLLPVCLWVAIRLIPVAVWKDCQASALQAPQEMPKNGWFAFVVIIIWVLSVGLLLTYIQISRKL